MNTEINIGIDTSQSQLDIFVRPSGDFFSVENTPQGANKVAQQLSCLKPTRVLIEATGRLEMNFVIAAHRARLLLVVCNPGKVRQFAKSIGRLAKTDKLDAQDIAHYGEATKPRQHELKPKKVALVACMRKQLVILNTMVKNGTHWDENMA